MTENPPVPSRAANRLARFAVPAIFVMVALWGAWAWYYQFFRWVDLSRHDVALYGSARYRTAEESLPLKFDDAVERVVNYQLEMRKSTEYLRHFVIVDGSYAFVYPPTGGWELSGLYVDGRTGEVDYVDLKVEELTDGQAAWLGCTASRRYDLDAVLAKINK